MEVNVRKPTNMMVSVVEGRLPAWTLWKVCSAAGLLKGPLIDGNPQGKFYTGPP